MNLTDVKKLRDMTAVGINDCKQALAESNGDFNQALRILKEKGAQVMAQKKDRKTSQGLVDAYLHFSGTMGALVEVNCETDFVARNEAFKQFVKDLALHVAAANPHYLKKEEVPADVLAKEPDADGFIKSACLLEQTFVKDNSRTIGSYLRDIIAQTGENIVIKRVQRFALGE